jgi:DNA-binding MarR family transcriptional regulator
MLQYEMNTAEHESEHDSGRDSERGQSVRTDASLVADLVREVYRSATVIAADLGRAAGVHATDADAMRVLDAATGRPTMGELGSELGLSSAAVTALVDRLERAGLARRIRDDDDRRRIRVELTDRAYEVAAVHLRPLMARITSAIGATPPADLTVIASFLVRLMADQ